VSTSAVDPHRLPRHARPSRYEITLTPDLDTARFDGTVRIQFEVDEQGHTTLTLNAAELEIANVEVDGKSATFHLDDDLERLIVETTDELTVGGHLITVDFTGTINDKLRGFYRSTYTDENGNQRVIATTQMQSTDCRRAFPCWDEPDFKATFAITLVVADDLLAVSNSPEVSRAPAGKGHVAITFGDTMAMSTYLVAFVVGPLEATDWIDVDGIPLRIVHVPGKEHLAGFGLEVGAFCLRWFQEYYGIAYPADKVEMLALPDFAAGAMENLGCITFRENLLLVDPTTATQPERQLVADVVAHELAHMWFGDLVTMRWWNGIWLNEAFATFMEIAACDAFRPEWGRWLTFGLERTAAFETDSLSSTRSVEFEVRSPQDAEGMFDVLTYQKGGALLRMLEQHLGAEAFRSGVSHYLRRHALGNTETSDLWDAIEEVTGEPVRQIMDSWIWQPGYPLVEADIDTSGRLVLRQSRFSFDPDDTDDTVWMIPLAIRTDSGTQRVLMSERDLVIDLDGDGPVVVNASGDGFVRVAYSNALIERLVQAIDQLSVLERYCLVDDGLAAVHAGRLDASGLFDLLEGFRNETSLPVWQAIASALRTLRRWAPDERTRDVVAERTSRLVGPTLQRLGEPVENEPELEGTLRGLLLRTMALIGRDQGAITRCAAAIEAHRAGTSVDAELLAAATTVVAATGDEAEYQRLLEGYRHGATPQEQLRNLYALAEFDDEALVLRTCELAMSDEVKTQNAPFLLRSCIANPSHGSVAWAFVARHWSDANSRFPTNTIVRMIDSVKLLTGEAEVHSVQSFFAEHPIPQAEATLRQVLERQRVNARCAEAQRPILMSLSGR
jgi:puromycin-sensitive aminopeptidase